MSGPTAADREWMAAFAKERLKATEGWDPDFRAFYLNALGDLMANHAAHARAYKGRPRLTMPRPPANPNWTKGLGDPPGTWGTPTA